MRNTILTLLLIASSLFAFAQKSTDIVGKWYNAEKDAVVTIFEENNSLSGKITWMLHPNDENGNPKRDPLNPDEGLRSRARLGMVMMHSFSHIEGRIWDNGKLYDPKKGKTYTGMVTLIDANTLDLRGYLVLSVLGRSSTWTRKLD